MKKIVILGLIILTSMMLAGCKGEEKPKDEGKGTTEQSQENVSSVSEIDTADAGENAGELESEGTDGVSTLCTDDKSIRITINRPEGFEDSEYSSEHQVSFQKVAEGGAGSTQMSMRLMAEDENSVMTTAQQEVEYLLSANSDGTGVVEEIQSQPAGSRQWSYFTYSLDDTEGLRSWAGLSNGCVVSCTVENLGSGLDPLSVDAMLQILDGSIQE